MIRQWLLEGYLGKEGSLLRIPLDRFPVTVGRDPESILPLIRPDVSRHHAVFEQKGDELWLRDLGSTNGTFVNRQPLKGQIQLKHGDVIHFSVYELRLLDETEGQEYADSNVTQLISTPLKQTLPSGLSELQLLLDEHAVDVAYQPIVDLDGRLFAYELLGRGARRDLPRNPAALFQIAESVPHKAAELSVLMRNHAVRCACQGNERHRLFVNTHPLELADMQTLLDDVLRLKHVYPELQLILEIHEDAVTDVDVLREFSLRLRSEGIGLAYDDFGAGRARLVELVDVPVDFVKFDMRLIRGLHQASEAKQDMVATLARMTRALGIKNLAEGVEQKEELEICRQMGFDLIQGYYFSKPRPAMDYLAR